MVNGGNECLGVAVLNLTGTRSAARTQCKSTQKLNNLAAHLQTLFAIVACQHLHTVKQIITSIYQSTYFI